MKYLIASVALVASVAAGSAFAQVNPEVAPTTPAAAQWQSAAAQPTPQATQEVPSYAQPIHAKTRAEVYQELVQAQQDGSLAIMNKTYAGS